MLSADAQLWVDKHRPRTSHELVGNNALVVTLRAWLNQWQDLHLRKRPVQAFAGGGVWRGVGGREQGRTLGKQAPVATLRARVNQWQDPRKRPKGQCRGRGLGAEGWGQGRSRDSGLQAGCFFCRPGLLHGLSLLRRLSTVNPCSVPCLSCLAQLS